MMYDDFGVGPGPNDGLPPWPAEGQGLDVSIAGGGPGGPTSPTLFPGVATDVNGTRTSPTAEGRRNSNVGDNSNAGNSIRGSPSQAGGGAGGVSPSRSPSLRPPLSLQQSSPSGKESNKTSPLRSPAATAGGGGVSSPSPSSKGGAGGGWSPESKSVAVAAASPSSSKKNSPSKGSVSGGGSSSLVMSAAGGGGSPIRGSVSSPSSKGPLSPHGSTILLPIKDTDNNNVPPEATGTVDGGLDAGSSLTTLHEGSSLVVGGASASSKSSGKGKKLKEEIDEDAEQLFQSFEGCFLHPDAIEQVVAKKAADETCVLLAFTISSLQMGMNYRVKVGKMPLVGPLFTHVLTLASFVPSTLTHPQSFARHQVRGVNALGKGPWSTISYAVPTAAGTPAQPVPPKASEQTMSSLTYSWDAPDDNG